MPAADLFGDDFDDRPDPPPAEAAVADEVEIQVSYSAADLAAARTGGWAEGRVAGLTEAARAREARVADLLGEIAAQWCTAQEEWAASAEVAATELAQLLCAAMRAMMPALCARHGAAEITAVAAEILPKLADERVVRVQVAQENVALLEPLIAGLDLGTDVEFRLTALDTLGPSDIRIRWYQGEALRNATDQWQRVAAILAPQDFLPATDDTPMKALAHVN